MAKNKNTALQTTDIDDHVDTALGVVVYADPNDAFSGFEGELFPEVWGFKTPGQTLDCTVIGLSAPVYVKDEYEEEIVKNTWECAIASNVRIRLLSNAQLEQMMPKLFGKRIRLMYVETIQNGKRQVKQYRAATFADQGSAVQLTEEERERNATFLAELSAADEAKRVAARERARKGRPA